MSVVSFFTAHKRSGISVLFAWLWAVYDTDRSDVHFDAWHNWLRTIFANDSFTIYSPRPHLGSVRCGRNGCGPMDDVVCSALLCYAMLCYAML